jgi:hypothetical protein
MPKLNRILALPDVMEKFTAQGVTGRQHQCGFSDFDLDRDQAMDRDSEAANIKVE